MQHVSAYLKYCNYETDSALQKYRWLMRSVQGLHLCHHFTYLWWAGLEPQQPEASSQQLLGAGPGSAPRSSPVDAGHRPGPISAAGFHPPEAAASAPGGRAGPPCPCYCWPTRCRLEFRQCEKKKTVMMHTLQPELPPSAHKPRRSNAD